MRKTHLTLFLSVLLLATALKPKAQPNVLATWPVGVPLCYLKFLSDGTYEVDTTGRWQPYRHSDTPAFAPDYDNGILFQCNGNLVANRNGDIINGGDSLTDNIFYNEYSPVGNVIHQSIIILPATHDKYWIFYYSYSDSLWIANTGSPDRLYYALVDMNANNGGGQIIKKKMPVYKGVMGDCRLTAVRHGNGKDWWLVNHGYVNDVYNKFLVTADTVTGPFEQHIGAAEDEPDLFGGAQFNADGTKYASGTIGGPMNIMDFDRCTGLFSNAKSVSVFSESPWQPSTKNSVVHAVCFSPNGRYLYCTTLKYLLQYDTWATPIDSSRTLIAKADSTYKNDDPFYSIFATPHNKIIIANLQGFPLYCNYHTIEQPDTAGLACDFRKESLYIPSSYSNYTLPNVINLKLGALPGSACDTITAIENALSATQDIFTVKVFPNPSANLVFIESASKEAAGTLTVSDALGRMQYSNHAFEQATVIQVKEWQNGIYFWSITTTTVKKFYGKFIVQH